MLTEYLGVALFIVGSLVVVAGLLGTGLLLQWFVGSHRPNPAKLAPYECGVPGVGAARGRFTVRFYIIAMLYVAFDVEVVFLFPWAVTFNQLGLFGLVEMFIFIVLLLVGYLYAWEKGALDWV